MLSTRSLRWLPALLFAAAGSAQTTYTVQGGGGALQAAINAAAPGDTLDVQPSLYAPVTCSIGLRFRLQPGVEVGSAGSSTLGMIFSSLPAQQTAIVAGGLVHGIAAAACAGTLVIDGTNVRGGVSSLVPAMQFNGCAGPMVFDQVQFSPNPGTSALGQLVVQSCAQVSFTGCLLPHTRITSSNVSLANTTIRPEGPYVAGLHVLSGSVVVNGGVINGSYMFSLPIPTVGAQIDAGQLTVTGGSLIQRASWYPTTWHAIQANGGTLRLDPSVTVTGAPAVVGPGIVFLTPIPHLAVAHTVSAMNVTLGAPPGSAVFTFGGSATPAFATPWGDAWLLPSDPILDVSILPATGAASFAKSFAAVPPDFVLVVQSVALTPSGTLVVGAPVRFAWN